MSFRKTFVFVLPLLIGALYAYYAVPILMIHVQTLVAIVTFVLLHCIVLSLGALFRPLDPRPGHRRPVVVLGLALVLTVPFAFMQAAFGTRDLGSLLITINENQLGNMAAVGMEGFLPDVGLYLGVAGALILGAWLLTRHAVFGTATVYGLALLLILFGPITQYVFRSLVPSPAHAMVDPGLASGGPDIMTRPETRKNLVIVYLESVERTYRDLAETAEAFAPLAALEDRGLSFRNLSQAEATGFTAGGLVATQCGVPLVPRGAFSVRRKIHDNIDVIPDETAFMVSVPCLGDVLAAEGYQLSYINGSVLTIFSKGDFFRSHGYQRVKGLRSWPGWETEPRQNIWGMDDDLLFERVTDELRDLAAGGAPFVLSTLTIATHGPDAYPDKTCPVPDGAPSQLPAAIACTGAHIEALLDEIDRLGIADDTLVVLVSDHLAFRNTLDDALQAVRADRRNFAVVLGAGQGVNLRAGTMLDIYPTLLELLGYRLEAGRAGLGQSLVAETPTFVEREGLETLSAAIRYNTALQQALWAPPEG